MLPIASKMVIIAWIDNVIIGFIFISNTSIFTLHSMRFNYFRVSCIFYLQVWCMASSVSSSYLQRHFSKSKRIFIYEEQNPVNTINHVPFQCLPIPIRIVYMFPDNLSAGIGVVDNTWLKFWWASIQRSQVAMLMFNEVSEERIELKVTIWDYTMQQNIEIW